MLAFLAEALLGCRELAKKYTTILKLDSTMGHETAKRVASEVEMLP